MDFCKKQAFAERNRTIYQRHLLGATHRQLADSYQVSVTRIEQIIWKERQRKERVKWDAQNARRIVSAFADVSKAR